MLPVKHQINLYLPRFRPPKLPREILMLLMVSAITILGVLIVTLAGWLFNSYTESKIEQLQVDKNQKANELKILTAQLPQYRLDSDLEANIQKTEEHIKRQNKIISFLNQDLVEESESFTPLFEQLSQQRVSGIWLSKIEILNSGEDIQLYGSAKTPEKVSQYISGLGEKSAYSGRSFKQINVIQADHARSDFFLSTKKQRSIREQPAATPNVIGVFGL